MLQEALHVLDVWDRRSMFARQRCGDRNVLGAAGQGQLVPEHIRWTGMRSKARKSEAKERMIEPGDWAVDPAVR